MGGIDVNWKDLVKWKTVQNMEKGEQCDENLALCLLQAKNNTEPGQHMWRKLGWRGEGATSVCVSVVSNWTAGDWRVHIGAVGWKNRWGSRCVRLCCLAIRARVMTWECVMAWAVRHVQKSTPPCAHVGRHTGCLVKTLLSHRACVCSSSQPWIVLFMLCNLFKSQQQQQLWIKINDCVVDAVERCNGCTRQQLQLNGPQCLRVCVCVAMCVFSYPMPLFYPQDKGQLPFSNVIDTDTRYCESDCTVAAVPPQPTTLGRSVSLDVSQMNCYLPVPVGYFNKSHHERWFLIKKGRVWHQLFLGLHTPEMLKPLWNFDQ